MQYAVKSFATRALDEWVLDYPQQVVMTTLNLVLTNEINDILEEKQRQKELEDAEGSDNDGGDDMEDVADEVEEGEGEANKEEAPGEEKSKNTPAAGGDTTQRDSVNKESQDEGPAVNKKTLKGTVQLKLSPPEQKKRLQSDLFGEDFKPDERFNKAIDQAIEDVRQRRVQ